MQDATARVDQPDDHGQARQQIGECLRCCTLRRGPSRGDGANDRHNTVRPTGPRQADDLQLARGRGHRAAAREGEHALREIDAHDLGGS